MREGSRRGTPSRSGFGQALTALTLILLALAATASYAAGAEGAKEAVTVTLGAEPQKDGSVLVSAKAVKQDGRPASNQALKFFVVADFLVSRPMRVGSGVTDSMGMTAVRYRPTWSGSHQFRVNFAGNDTLAPAEGTTEVQLAAVTAPYSPAPRALAPLRRAVGTGALAATLSVWAMLLIVVARVVWSLAGPTPAALPKPAAARRGSMAD